MELSSVKTAVKTWEKSFKAKHGRPPTKDDIKKDPTGIAEQYAVYRKLSKSSESQSQSQSLPKSVAPSSASTSASTSYRNGSTPVQRPIPEYPTTPTPPARRVAPNLSRPKSDPLSPVANDKASDGTAKAKSLKRTASKALLAPHSPPPPVASSSRTLFITPKKPKPSANGGPIYDPNPLNPFSTTPTKPSSASRSLFTSTATSVVNDPNSPFVHFSSPRKLKEMLLTNSAKKLIENEGQEKEITPRTKARKRLRGEIVNDTPIKDKPTRRRRGEGRSSSSAADSGEHPITSSSSAADNGNQSHSPSKQIFFGSSGVVNDEDEEIGPSPLKPGPSDTRRYRSLFDEEDVKAEGSHNTEVKDSSKQRENGKTAKRVRPSEIMGILGRSGVGSGSAPSSSKDQSRGPKTSQSGNPNDKQTKARSPPILPPPIPESPLTGPMTPEPEPEESLSTPPPDPVLEEASKIPTPSRRLTRPSKVLSFSDDEEADEWDPEGGSRKHQVVIVPTRGKIRRIKAYGEIEDDEVEQVEINPDDAELEDDEIEEDVTSSNGVAENQLAPPLLSLLSLQSPARSAAMSRNRLNELRVKAIFDPAGAATQLKALKKGQDVYVSGEAGGGIGEDEAEGVLLEGEGGDGGDEGGGDDDWESEDEGWKRSTMGLEEEEEDW